MPRVKKRPTHGKQVKARLDPTQLVLIAGLSGAVAAMASVSVIAYRYGIAPGELGDPMLVVEPFLPMLLGGIGAVVVVAVVLSRFKEDWRRTVSWRLAPVGLLLLGAGVAGYPDGSIYAPAELVHWTQWFAENGLPGIRMEAFTVFGGAWAIITAGMMAAAKPGLRGTTGSHGTAAWSDGDALLRPEGLILGRDIETGKLLRWETDGHALTVARTRSGKGVGSIIPNLLTYNGPVVVTDPKGENYQVSRRQRLKVLGQETVALDPFRLVTSDPDSKGRVLSGPEGKDTRPAGVTLNVLSGVPDKTGAVVEAADLTADMLVIKTGQGGESSFWNTEAQAWISSLVLYTMAEFYHGYVPPARYPDVDGKPNPHDPIKAPDWNTAGTLVRVRELLNLDSEGTKALVQVMQSRNDYGGRVAAAGRRFAGKAEKERSGVISTAQSHTHFMESPEIAAVLSNGDNPVRLEQLLDGTLSLYIVLPASRLETYSRWQRLVVAYALKAITDGGRRPKKRVLFVLDEFANLQRMEPVRRAVSLLAGYGASLWIFLQDLSQLKTLYGDGHETFIANAEVFQVFGTADVMTAEYVSKRAGDTTVWTETESETKGSSKKGGGTRNRSRNTSEKGRRLVTPDEVLTSDPRTQFLFVADNLPVQALKVRYYADPEFKGLYDVPDMLKQAA